MRTKSAVKSNRPRAQFRLASMLIVMTVAAVIVAVEADRRRKANAIDELEKLGGSVRKRQLVPAWATQLGVPEYQSAKSATLELVLLPDGSLLATNDSRTKQAEKNQVSIARLLQLSARAGFAPEHLRLGIFPRSNTPSDATIRANEAANVAGFGSLWHGPTEGG